MNTITTEMTAKALEESIAHWERLVNGNRMPGEYIGSTSCALCRLFHSDCHHDMAEDACCGGCPVYEKTGKQFCKGTPFKEAAEAVSLGFRDPTFQSAAKLELDFLKSLRKDK